MLSALTQKLWGVTFTEELQGAVVRGFDQAKAIEFSIYVFGTLVCIVAPLLLAFSGSWLLGVGYMVLIFCAWLVFAQFLRFKASMSREGIVLQRTWAGLCYARRKLPLGARIESRGMGDWDEDGEWPAKRLCEITPKNEDAAEELIGTGRTAEQITAFLARNQAKFLVER